MKHLLKLVLLVNLTFTQIDWNEGGIPVRQGYHVEWFRGGDISSDGDMFIVWSDTRTSTRDVYAQKVNSDGDIEWVASAVMVSGGDGRQEDPIIISDNNGGAYISWRDYSNDPLYGELYAQHINSEGQNSWEGKLISSNISILVNSQQNMCSDLQGGVYVSWYEDSGAGSGDYYAIHLDSSGNLAGPEKIIETQMNYGNVSLESAGGGSAVIAWKEGETGSEDIFSQKIGVNNGNIIKTWNNGNPVVVCDAIGRQSSPKVTYYSDDFVVLVWEDWRSDDFVSAVGANFIDENGNKVFSVGNDLVYTTNTASTLFPRVKAKPEGAFVIWLSAEDVHYVQKMTTSNINVWNAPVGLSGFETQQQARLSADNNGGAYIVWEDGEYENKSIKIEHLNSNGETTFSSILSNTDSEQFAPLVRANSVNGAYVVWADGAGSTNGITSLGLQYQYVSSSGTALSNSIELFYGFGGQIQKGSTRSMKFDENNNLIYWQDFRNGVNSPQTYGSLGGQTEQFNTESKLSNYSGGQYSPQIARIDNSTLFMSFYNSEFKACFQLLNNNLEPLGEAMFVNTNSSNEQASNELKPMIFSDEIGSVYYGYSESNGIYMQKYNESGSAMWPADNLVASNDGDNYLNGIFSTDDSGIIILHDNRTFLNKEVRVTKINSDGTVVENWNNSFISENGVKSYFEDAIETSEGIFVVWRDDDGKIFSKHILFSNSNPASFDILNISESNALYSGTVSLDYSVDSNEVMVCWQEQLVSVYNISCASVDLENLSVIHSSYVYENSSTQKRPMVQSTNFSTFLVSWEDERLGNYADLYIQELTGSGNLLLNEQGDILCNAVFNQYNRDIQSIDNNNSYIAFWEDDRSSGKEFVTNIFAQKMTISGCSSDLGDMNSDGAWNVLDVVALANCVISQTCSDL